MHTTRILDARHSGARPLVAMLLLPVATACFAQNASRELSEQSAAIARAAAEIDRRIADESGNPRKTFISPSTRELGYATYYKGVAHRLEEAGTRNFPQKDGKKLYGSLILTIPIFQDGSLYMKQGGPRIDKSSGNADLDAAALAIVRNAAPFGPIPAQMRTAGIDDVWVVKDTFNFTRREEPEPQAQETK